MKFIYVLEDDERIQKDLFESLQSIDYRLHIRFFSTLAQFHDWLKLAVQTGPKALAMGGFKYKYDKSENLTPSATHQLRLVIAKNEMMGVQNLGLIKRAQEFFLRKQLCPPHEPTALILTAFDSPDFDISLAEQRIINNVIFKPFDKLILKQHLEYALTGHHPVSITTVASMNLNSTIEMLKDISLNSLTETGFSSINNHEIPVGAFAKYYGESFRTDNKRSALAYCTSCKKISEKEYFCEFRYFGIDNQQISQIRRNILQNKNFKTSELKNTSTKNVKILVVDENLSAALDLKDYLLDKISNAEVFVYSNYGQMLSDLADKDTVHRQQLPANFDIVFGTFELFEVEMKKRWEQIGQYLTTRMQKNGIVKSELPTLFLTSKKQLSAETLRAFNPWVADVLFLPLDRAYLLKKLLSHTSSVVSKETTTLTSTQESNSIKVANPVEITEISEAGLVLKYYREISIGAFREFILVRNEETETTEIVGTVNFNEKDKSNEKSFLNHFVFFGMKDYYLKHIRLWLREAYIKSKDQE